MLALTLTYDVPPERVITLTLPESVTPGQHQLAVIVDEPALAAPGVPAAQALRAWLADLPEAPVIPAAALDRDALY